MSVRESIGRGDHVEVSPLEKHKNGPQDFGVLRAVALDGISNGGSAVFNVEIRIGEVPVELRLNVNDVDVKLLFSARVARSLS